MFAGAKKSFSDTLLRNVKLDCGFALPIRHESIEEYISTIGGNCGESRVVIVDPFLCNHSAENLYAFAEAFSEQCPNHDPPGLAVAYWDVETGERLYRQLEDRVDLRGLVPMNLSIDIWLSIIRLLANGGTYFPAELTERHVSSHAEPSPAGGAVPTPCRQEAKAELDLLTSREIEVLEKLTTGLQNKHIAEHLGVSEHTVKLHIHHIIGKLDVRNRTEAAIKFQTMRSAN
ncbi:regulatory protein, luxR family [Vannielia litorea]|uniref:Regulatory protein, luxR family n=1 Tax=Vannielia litorea TaxID=1217970 RepID=A0A1N6E606_9RHOB|nr:regulatory protein, luxR family [Vannielia litorea]